MINSDRKPFFDLIASISAFYRQDFSTFSGKVWFEAMKPFDFDAVSDALNRHCVNPDVGQFMPKPADVVRMLQGSTQDSALAAWAKFDRALRTVGTWRSVVFDDPLIHRCITEMGGWVCFGEKDEKDWPFLKNEFVNRYRGYRGRNEVPDYPPVLAGVIESNNNRLGAASQPPVLLGDPKKACAVLEMGSNRQLLEIHEIHPQQATKLLQLADGRYGE